MSKKQVVIISKNGKVVRQQIVKKDDSFMKAIADRAAQKHGVTIREWERPDPQ